MSKITTTSLMKIFSFLFFWFAVVLTQGVGAAEEEASADYRNDEVQDNKGDGNKSSIRLAMVRVAVVVGVVGVCILCVYYGYKRWQRKKREVQQARLMKLFEPDDQLDEELSGNNTV